MDVVQIILSFGAPCFVMVLYLYFGLRRTSRAKTVAEHLIYNKKMSGPQYATTMVSYALQVVITVYFIYWGFKYGIGVIWYIIFWWLGIYLFELSSPKLLKFARGKKTLHGYLDEAYGTNGLLRKITASCTILGLLGALLIEANFTTDILTNFARGATGNEISHWIWVTIFLSFVFFALWYMTLGGFKASVITDEMQLPFSIFSISFVLGFLSILGASNGYHHESRYLILLTLLYLFAIYFFRKRNITNLIQAEGNEKTADKNNPKDRMKLSLIISGLIMLIGLIVTFLLPESQVRPDELVGATPIYSISALVSQLGSWNDWLVLLSFFILDISWQFVDMAAWQRIESIDLSGLEKEQAISKISSVIRSTKWESPLSWSLGVLIGFGLHYSGLYNTVEDADNSLTEFVVALTEINFGNNFINVLAIFTLPFLIIAFISIMISTVDSCISAITFSSYSDYGGEELNRVIKDSEKGDLMLLRKSQRISFFVVIFGVIVFLGLKYLLNLSPFLIINLAYASQLSLLPIVVYVLFGDKDRKMFYKEVAIASVLLGLVGTYPVGIALSKLDLEDLAYTIPTISCVIFATVSFFIFQKVKRLMI